MVNIIINLITNFSSSRVGKWIVLSSWILIAGLIIPFAPQLTESVNQTDFLPESAESTKAARLVEERYSTGSIEAPSIIVAQTKNKAEFTSSEIQKLSLEKKTEILNIKTEEIGPSLGNAKYYTYRELNCNYVETAWSVERVMNNLETMTVLIYQELTTDIKGDPN